MEQENSQPVAPLSPAPAEKIASAEHLSRWRQLKLAVTRVIIVLATIFTARYFVWRLLHTMNPAARVFFYFFLAAELLSFLESVLFYFITWNPTHYAQPKTIPGHTVDVFIPTYNEPVELLRETVVCAVNMRYPHKTYILDDGNRNEVRELALEFDCGYIARSERTNAKAGNLNNAFGQTDGEFIVTLDADHVASPELIEDLIGFFTDPKIAVVQATQDFYNLDSFQHNVNWSTRAGWQQQELFFSVIQPGKDRYNAAFYCGSPGILRRSALQAIDGFATDSITEDMHTSLRLQKQGWRVLYYNRTVARGLAPQTFTSFATQWRRWGHGAMQIYRQENPMFGRGLSLGQRLGYFGSFVFYWMSFQRLFFVLTPIIALGLGVFPLLTDPLSFASFWLPYFCLNLVSSVLLQGGWKNFLYSEQFNLLKMHVLMKAIVGLFSRESVFVVTQKARASAAKVSEVLLPFGILVGLVLSIAVGVLRIQQVPLWGYFFWALAVNIFWGIVFLFMMATVVQRSLQRKELRPTYRVPLPADVRLQITYPDQAGASVSPLNFASNLHPPAVSLPLDNPLLPRPTLP